MFSKSGIVKKKHFQQCGFPHSGKAQHGVEVKNEMLNSSLNEVLVYLDFVPG